MIIVDTATEAATDWYVRIYYSSGDIEGYGYLTPLLAIASSKIHWLLVVATVADADTTTATAVTVDVIATPLVCETNGAINVYVQVLLVKKEITIHTGRYSKNANNK